MSSEAGVAGATSSGALWTMASTTGIRVLRVAVFIVLARQLGAEDFGLVALASIFTSALLLLVTGGFGQLLIQRSDIDQELRDSTFWFSSLSGLLLTALLWLLAPTIADAFDQPELVAVLRGLAPVLLLTGVGSAARGLLARDLRLTAIAGANAAAAGVSAIFGVALALAGAGVWALVVQTVAESALSTAVCILRAHYRPGLEVSRAALSELLRFGTRVTGGNLLTFASTRLDDLLIGAVLGPVALGIYSVAYRLLVQIQEVIWSDLWGVGLPTFSRLHQRVEIFRDAWHRTAQYMWLGVIPVFTAAALFSATLVEVLFGFEWRSAVPVMVVLALVGPAASATELNSVTAVAAGHPGAVLRFNLLNLLGNVLAFGVGVQFGIIWVAIGFAIRGYISLPFSYVMLRGVLVPLSVRELAGDAAPFILCTGLAAAAGATSLLFMNSVLPGYALLGVAGGIYVLTYCAAVWCLRPDLVSLPQLPGANSRSQL